MTWSKHFLHIDWQALGKQGLAREHLQIQEQALEDFNMNQYNATIDSPTWTDTTIAFLVEVKEKCIVGIVRVEKEYYQDPTDKTGKFVVVDVKAVKKLKNPISLEQIKLNNKLKNIALVKQSRLSVMPLKKTEWDTIIKMSN